MKRPVEWFLVISETRARIVRGLPAPGAAPAAELVIRAPHRNLHEIMADKPGRSFSPGSAGRRSAMENGSDPLLRDKVEFLHQALALVEAHRRAGSFDRLAIVAGPRMLGLVRAELSTSLRGIVSREIALNLGGLPEAALPDALRREMARI
ncbi:host attachment protein [Jannaschia formosa]|uniref:host attachment protein n=1 Tax=Jannaschia formosa TaxID=2259592 RepID=UPI00143101AE|nr:host attachment protein [Jannaschia formosa]